MPNHGSEPRTGGGRSSFVPGWLIVGVVVCLAAAAAISLAHALSADRLRERVVAELSKRLDADVELGSFRARVFPALHVNGSDLVIRPKGRRDVPPFISVRAFSVDAGFAGAWRKHIAHVELTGLDIEVPPGRSAPGPAAPEMAPRGSPGAGAPLNRRENAGASVGADAAPGTPQRRARGDSRDVVIDDLESREGRVVILPDQADKPVRVWAIHRLRMHQVGFDRPMPFEADLTNAVPPGEIRTRGIFGPWEVHDPGATPLDGTFTLVRADLAVFHGISGLLSAHGEFGGTLGRLGIHGETETPDFTVAVGGHPMRLHTDYHATVDGTTGDTLLDRIDGSFGQTSLTARGSVIGVRGQDGRTVALDIRIDRGRLEDVLRLAVSAPRAPMTGGLNLTAAFRLPPGERDVIDKLRLDGRFSLRSARFTDPAIQKKVSQLSYLARGRPREGAPIPGSSQTGSEGDDGSRQPASARAIASNFKGRFELSAGVLTLPVLTFDVPGADVRLSGRYALHAEMLDFKGTLLMDAKVSDTQTGLKRLLLKVVDPLFNKAGGGSAIPIRIAGKRTSPSIGLDRERLFRR